MPSGTTRAAAKRKAIRPVKRKTSGGGRGRRRRRRAGRSRLPVILLVILLIVGIGAAWHFGFIDLDELLREAARPPIVAVDGQMEIHFIDAGQADATFIITDGGTMLIDAGSRSSGPRVVEYLRSLNINEITYVVGTHPHEDHIGGMDLILNEFTVGTLLIPPVSHTTLTYERMIAAIENNNVPTRSLAAGSTINLGGAIFTVIHPNSDNYHNLNDWSISFRMAFGGVSMVTTGDAERPAELEMIAAGHYLSADILRLGHHGSRTSTSQEFFDAVSPSIIVIQVGEGNRYGHPHPEVMDRIAAAGINRIYRNDRHGDIILTTDGTNIDIRTAR